MVNWKKHLLILILIALLQFFLYDIVAWLYLKNIEHTIEDIVNKNDVIYSAGEYKPFFERNNISNNGWEKAFNNISNYKFAIIREEGGYLEEIYFTKKGTKEIFKYNGNKIVYHSTEEDYPSELSMIFVYVALLLFGIGVIHFHLRNGSFWTFNVFRYERIDCEKILEFYGAGIGIIWMIVSAIRLR